MQKLLFLLIFGLLGVACSPDAPEQKPAEDTDIFKGDSPWPEIRKKRIAQLLPQALKAAGVDAWLIICRENNNDPLAHHVGGENAGGEAAFLFFLDGDSVKSVVFSPVGEATALRDLKIHDEVINVARDKNALTQLADYLSDTNIKNIAINSSTSMNMGDGISATQKERLMSALGPKYQLVSADEVIYEWLSIKLPEEVEIMTKAAELTAAWQIEAYEQIIPGITTDAEVAKFLKQKMAAYGVTDGWSPDQNPNVNSGADRGHSHATDKVIMPGDVIQTDFGIKVFDMWVTDIQRFAYVLREGEENAPDSVLRYWEGSKSGSRIALATMKPGVTGYDVDKAQRALMEKNGSSYVMWSTGHPVGYVAHDIGPSLGGAQVQGNPRPASLKVLKEGQVFAFDGFHAWELADGSTKTMSVEEMAVITADGARYLIAPQEELILVKSKK